MNVYQIHDKANLAIPVFENISGLVDSFYITEELTSQL